MKRVLQGIRRNRPLFTYFPNKEKKIKFVKEFKDKLIEIQVRDKIEGRSLMKMINFSRIFIGSHNSFEKFHIHPGIVESFFQVEYA